MHRITMKWLVTIFGVMIISLTLLGLVCYQVITDHYQSYAQQTLINQATSYSEILSVNFDTTVLKQIAKIKQKHASSMFVFSSDKKLLITSEPIEHHDFIQLAQTWVQTNSSQSTIHRKIGEKHMRIILAKSPIYRDGTLLGTIVLVRELTWLENTLESLQMMLLLAGIGTILVASGLGLLFSRQIVKPILDMGITIKQLSKGNYQERIQPIHTGDELSILAKQVNQLAESLDYYRSTRKEFLSNVAHELRTPLTYLKGYAILLENPTLEPQLSQKLIQIIHKQADRLEKLVNDLVTLSRLDEGQLVLKQEKVEMGALLQNIVEEVTPHAEQLGIKIKLITDNLQYAWIDPNRVDQIILNLIDNALCYSNEQGTVTIVTSSETKWFMISIIDEGIGMTPEQLKQIWERFYRVDKSRSRRTGGTGLGLSIVRDLVQLHEGKISVESKLDQGTTFTLYFPRYEYIEQEGNNR